jgi:hypothetical protein
VPDESEPTKDEIRQLEKDSNGDIITRPVTGWTTGTLAGIAVLLVLEYAESPQELETGHSKSIQLALSVQQSLELAERLRTLGKRLLEDRSHGETKQ